MRRELRIVDTEEVIGAVVLEQGGVHWIGHAGSVLADMRRRLGDEAAARAVMDGGWSNGYVYLAEATP